MKIVMLCRLYMPHRGGVERHVGGLAGELIKRRYTIEIVTEQFDHSQPLTEIRNGVRVHRIPQEKLTGKMGIWSWIFKHRDIFLGADLVHAHDVVWWYLPLRFLYFRKPVYATFHGYERVEGPTPGMVIWRLLSEKLSWGCICIGDWMRQWYGHNPTLVSFGAGSAPVSPLPKKRTAIFIGRLEKDTGILEYIRGVKLLKGRISLDIFGDGPSKSQVIKMIGKTRYIKHKGETSHPTQELVRHRFVFASQYLTMLEAQQTGRQVISFLGSGLKPDYLHSFPTITQVITFNSPEGLAKAMIALLADPKHETANIKKAQIWAKKQTWNKLADTYEQLWQK